MTELNQTLIKIQQLLNERNWSLYKLAKEANIPYSSLNSLFQKNNHPTIVTLEKICSGFHITMAEFFAQETPYRNTEPVVTPQEKHILDVFRSLNTMEQKKYIAIMEVLRD